MSRTRREIVTMDEIEAAMQEERELKLELAEQEELKEAEKAEMEEVMVNKVIHDYLKEQYSEYVLLNEDMAYTNKGSYFKIPYNEFVAKYANRPSRSMALKYVKYLETTNQNDKKDTFAEFLRKNS